MPGDRPCLGGVFHIGTHFPAGYGSRYRRHLCNWVPLASDWSSSLLGGRSFRWLAVPRRLLSPSTVVGSLPLDGKVQKNWHFRFIPFFLGSGEKGKGRLSFERRVWKRSLARHLFSHMAYVFTVLFLSFFFLLLRMCTVKACEDQRYFVANSSMLRFYNLRA